MLHLRELELPFAGELRLGELLHAETAQQRHELKRLRGRNQLAPLAEHVLLVQQAFDDRRARRGGAEPLLLHRIPQLVVFHQLAGAFHGAKQRRFRVAGGRPGLESLGRDGFGGHRFTRGDRHQALRPFGILVLRFLPVDREPAGPDQHLALGLEAVIQRTRDPGRDQVFRRREEHRHEAARDEIVELLFGLREILRRLQRRNDREVIADLGVVEDPAARLDVAVVEGHPGVRLEVRHPALREHLEGLLRHREIVLGQRPRIGARIRERLVPLVQTLGDRQRPLGGKAKPAVGLALQRRQVEQERAGLRGRLRLFGHDGRLAAHRIGNGRGFAFAPDAIGLHLAVVFVLLPRRVEPLARVVAGGGAEAGVDLPVVAADELADAFLALHHHGERRRLHAPHRRQEEAAVARVEGGHRARAVDADQPIRLRAGPGGVGQAVHLLVAAERLEAVADGLRRHRLQPEAPHRLTERRFPSRVLFDQAEDQLPLASRVTRVHEPVDVFAPGLLHDRVEPALGAFHRLQIETRGNHRQVREAPFAALHVEFFGGLDLQQVPHGAGDDVGVVLEMVFVLVELAGHVRERADDVLRHGWLLSDHQSLHLSTVSAGGPSWDNRAVQDRAAERRERMTVRRFPSNAAADAHDREYWAAIPPDRRLEMVWDLTLDLHALQGLSGDQPRLQRSVCRVERRGR